MKTPSLLLPILIGIVIGTLLGGFFPGFGLNLDFIGELFIHGLLMLVVPLVMTSMVTSITSLGDLRKLKGIGTKTIIFYMITTAIAVALGLVLVSAIKPGIAETEGQRILLRGGQNLETVAYTIEEQTVTLAGDQFRKTFDDRYALILQDQNIRGIISEGDRATITVAAWEDGAGETVEPRPQGTGVAVDLAIASKVQGKENSSIADTLKDVVVGLLPRNLFAAMANNDVLPLIIVSLVFGGILTTLHRAEPLIQGINALNDAIMAMVHLILLASPVGIGALIAGRLGSAGGFVGFGAEFGSIWKYAGTVIIGLIIHGIIILPLILKIFGKRNPFTYLRRMLPALTTAFSTASSSATLPLTMECTIDSNKIEPEIADFVLPLGATINMDGTALYEAVAAVFIAQIYGIDLGGGQLIVIFLTATLAAIGAAGIPEAGLVTMVIVLKAVNIPIEGISLILVIDWFLDRCRTTINVWGDTVGAAVVQALTKKTPDQAPPVILEEE